MHFLVKTAEFPLPAHGEEQNNFAEDDWDRKAGLAKAWPRVGIFKSEGNKFYQRFSQEKSLPTLFFPAPTSPGKRKRSKKTHFRQKMLFPRRAELRESPRKPSEDFVVVVGFVLEMKCSFQ